MKRKNSERHPEFSKVTSKGQFTLPKEIRDELEIEEGSLLAIFADKAKEIAIMKKIEPENVEKEFDELHEWGKEFVKNKPRMSLEEINRMIHKIRGVKHGLLSLWTTMW